MYNLLSYKEARIEALLNELNNIDGADLPHSNNDAVSQYGNTIANTKDFVQVVRNIDEADSSLTHGFDEIKKDLYLV